MSSTRKLFWTGLGLLLLVQFLSVVVQSITLSFQYASELPNLKQEDIQRLLSEGDPLSILLIVSSIVSFFMVRAMSKWSIYQGFEIKMPLSLPSAASTIGWVGITVIASVLFHFSGAYLTDGTTSEAVQHLIKTSTRPWLLFIGVAICAPVFEEYLFRGLLLSIWGHCFKNYAMPVVVTALAWSWLHQQYNAYELLQIFILGLLFGYARMSSGTIVVPIIMHAVFNSLSFYYAYSSM